MSTHRLIFFLLLRGAVRWICCQRRPNPPSAPPPLCSFLLFTFACTNLPVRILAAGDSTAASAPAQCSTPRKVERPGLYEFIFKGVVHLMLYHILFTVHRGRTGHSDTLSYLEKCSLDMWNEDKRSVLIRGCDAFKWPAACYGAGQNSQGNPLKSTTWSTGVHRHVQLSKSYWSTPVWCLVLLRFNWVLCRMTVSVGEINKATKNWLSWPFMEVIFYFFIYCWLSSTACF